MAAHALTCAIPAALAAEVTERMERAATIDGVVDRYAAPRFRQGVATIGAVLAVPAGSDRNG